MSEAFADRVALVTGGSRGIGRSTALSTGPRRGGRRHQLRLAVQRGRRGGLPRSGPWAAGRSACPATSPGRMKSIASSRERARSWGRSTCSPTAARSATSATIPGSPTELWLETIDVNLNGAFLVVFAVKDEMIARGFGRIVLVSSVAALRPRKMQIHYASSKAGVIALTRCCAEAFAPHNVRVNCVAPGLIETEMAHVLPDETMKRVVDETPMGRIGQPEEIAAIIRFLLSEESSFMTGETISASGGRVTLP